SMDFLSLADGSVTRGGRLHGCLTYGSFKPRQDDISLESFISHVTQTIVEGFVMDKDGPLSKMTTEYVLGLPKQEVSDITKEDKKTGQLREQLNSDIKKLEGAQEIAKDARAYIMKLSIHMAGDGTTSHICISVHDNAQQWAGSKTHVDVVHLSD
ncbi:hypothetical protein FOXB_05264, partial [Fusarium oxysporum f. sp. conglutinans Fo5176]